MFFQNHRAGSQEPLTGEKTYVPAHERNVELSLLCDI